MTDRKQALADLLHEIEAGTWPGDVESVIGGIGNIQIYRAYLGSLDFAKALHEAVLPGWDWGKNEHGIYVSMKPNRVGFYGQGDTPARAWLIAILKALISQEGEE